MDAKFFNSLTEGDFGNGFMLGQGLLEGDFWPRRAGCYNVYRGRDHIDNIDAEHIVATTTAKGMLSLADYLDHDPATNYYYLVRCISGSGKEEQGTMAAVLLSLDESGDQRPKRSNCVAQLSAWAVGGGKIQLSWWYWPLGQAVEPDHFAVFGDGGSGTIDFDVELAQVAYNGAYFYSYLTATGVDGQAYRFAVRAVSAVGDDDGNLGYVVAVVDLTGPASIEWIDGGGGF